MAQLYPYQFRPAPHDHVMFIPAVYKLHFGSKYFIWKGKTLKGSVEQNLTDIQKLLFRIHQPTHLFAPVVLYIRKARPLKAEVEVMVETEDPKLLLEVESRLLLAGEHDEACLNTVFTPHIPKWLAEALSFTPAKSGEPVFDKKRIEKRIEAIGDTFKVSADKVPVDKPVKPAGPVKTAPGKVNSLMDAFNKLNGGKA